MNRLKYIGVAICIFHLIACRGYQERSMIESSRYNQTERYDGLYEGFLKQDSNTYARFWYYQADSGFHYRPDSGLIGYGGLLRVYEAGQYVASVQSFRDSTVMHKQAAAYTHSEKDTKKKTDTLSGSRWFIAAILLVGLITVWLLRSRSRF